MGPPHTAQASSSMVAGFQDGTFREETFPENEVQTA